MEMKLIDFSVVVVANDHNPTLLNPDFLSRQSIVNDEWGWTVVGQPITTPPFAMVEYSSSVTVRVETNKLQVSDKSGKPPLESKAAEIARMYVEVLPHIPYRAVGINFQSTVKPKNPEGFIRRHFLKGGNWDTDANPLQEVGLKFLYRLPSGRLVLGLDHFHKPGEEAEEFILASSNFHRECVKGQPAKDQVMQFFRNMEDDWKYYNTLVSEMLAEDG